MSRHIAWQGYGESELVSRVSEALTMLALAPTVEREPSGISSITVGFVEGWNRAHDVWRLAVLIERARLPLRHWYERREFERLIARFDPELVDVLTPDA